MRVSGGTAEVRYALDINEHEPFGSVCMFSVPHTPLCYGLPHTDCLSGVCLPYVRDNASGLVTGEAAQSR